MTSSSWCKLAVPVLLLSLVAFGCPGDAEKPGKPGDGTPKPAVGGAQEPEPAKPGAPGAAGGVTELAGYPQGAPLRDGEKTRLVIHVEHELTAKCPCADLKIQQEMGGFMDVIGRDGSDPLRHPAEDITDLGARGRRIGIYPGDLVRCEQVNDQARISLFDDPGLSGSLGADYTAAFFHLNFDTTLSCGKDKIGELVWHVKYYLPESAGTVREVAAGEIK
jgi:hypothetical protein